MDIRRYDIVQADLGKAVGSEQAGIRPVLIVQNDQGNKFSNTYIQIHCPEGLEFERAERS